MSFNGAGTFNINTSGQPVVTSTTISSTAFNALTADLATGLSTAICKDGQTACTARIPFIFGINSSLTTDATSISTGSILTAGGIGCTKALWVGGLTNIAGALSVSGQVILNNSGSALATNATSGFTFLPSCAGTPTGVPASTPMGAKAFVYDSSNDVFYVYNSSWKQVGMGSTLNTEVGETSPVTSNSQNAYGTYIQVIASTAHSVLGVVLALSLPAFLETYRFQIATGGAGSETVKYTITVQGNATATSTYSLYLPLDPSIIGKGVRVAVNVANFSNANQRTINGCFFTLLEKND